MSQSDREKAILLIKEDLIRTDMVSPRIEDLAKKYGMRRAESMFEQIAEDMASDIVKNYNALEVLCLPNVFEFKSNLKEKNDLYERNTVTGKAFYFIDEPLKQIIFSGESITVYEGKGTLFTCSSVKELIEKVDLDMRTRKFKNVLRRRAGEGYSKDVEKVDMRRISFKDSMKRMEKYQEKRTEKKSYIEEDLEFDETSANIVFNGLQEIISYLVSPNDLIKLLVGIKNKGVNPIPLKNEMTANPERLLRYSSTNNDIKYVIKNIETYLQVAKAIFDPEEEKTVEPAAPEEKPAKKLAEEIPNKKMRFSDDESAAELDYTDNTAGDFSSDSGDDSATTESNPVLRLLRKNHK